MQWSWKGEKLPGKSNSDEVHFLLFNTWILTYERYILLLGKKKFYKRDCIYLTEWNGNCYFNYICSELSVIWKHFFNVAFPLVFSVSIKITYFKIRENHFMDTVCFDRIWILIQLIKNSSNFLKCTNQNEFQNTCYVF